MKRILVVTALVGGVAVMPPSAQVPVAGPAATHATAVTRLLIRGHRRDTPPNNVPDIGALVQTNPAQTTQVKYTGIRQRFVYESSFSIMDGQTNYAYQPGTPADAIRRVDSTLSTADFAAARNEEQPNSRHQLDNIFAYALNGRGGDHQLKGGVQFARLYWESRHTVQGDHWVEYANGLPTQVRQWNTPANPKNLARVTGFFFQDAWSVGSRLTLNLGMRYDRYQGILPEQSNPGGPFVAAASVPEQEVIDQKLAVWRTGASYDVTGNGRTALKASFSRYGLQVGIDRVTAVNPLSQLDIFNITNAATVVALNTAVGGTYKAASEILAPRIIRVGFSLNF